MNEDLEMKTTVNRFSDYHVYKVVTYGTLKATKAEVVKARLFYEALNYRVSIVWVGDRQEYIVMWRWIEIKFN